MGVDAVVEMVGVRKTYRTRRGRTVALDGLDLDINPGGVHALLGPNGAGKSTAIAAVATLTSLDGGSIRVAGHDVAREPSAVRRAIGLVTQGAAVDDALYAEENLELFGQLHDLDRRRARQRARELLDQFGLSDARGRKVATFSGGMRRRLDIASGLVCRPTVLLLDEPTTGLDPRGRLEVWDAVRRLVADGTTVLLTTQYLDEADRLADTITVLRAGRVAAHGTPTSLKQSLGADRIVVTASDPTDGTRVADLVGGNETEPGVVVIDVGDGAPADSLTRVLHRVSAADITISDISLRRPTLDEVFLELTGDGPERATGLGQ